MKLICWGLLVSLWLAANFAQAANKQSSKAAEIRRALSAAPASISAGAAVISMDAGGKMIELRQGNNGWTCLPRDEGTPLGQPLCLDKNGLQWYVAAMSGRAPDPDLVGYSYMLKGGSVWSNLDPSATKMPPGRKHFVLVPPHIMILNARIAKESGFPTGMADPDTHKPFVMFGDTPFAVLIIPVM